MNECPSCRAYLIGGETRCRICGWDGDASGETPVVPGSAGPAPSPPPPPRAARSRRSGTAAVSFLVALVVVGVTIYLRSNDEPIVIAGSADPEVKARALSVCRDGGNEALPPYEPGGRSSAAVAVVESPTGDGYHLRSFSGTSGSDLPELVACADRIAEGAVIGGCSDFETPSGAPARVMVSVRAATYDVRLLEARTGREVDRATIEGTDPDCPFATAGEPGTEVEYFSGPDDLEAWVGPHIGLTADGRSTDEVVHDTLPRMCFAPATNSPSSAPYEGTGPHKAVVIQPSLSESGSVGYGTTEGLDPTLGVDDDEWVDASLVVCIRFAHEILERCEYRNFAWFNRTRQTWDVDVLVATTGQSIARQIFVKELPPCPPAMPGDGDPLYDESIPPEMNTFIEQVLSAPAPG